MEKKLDLFCFTHLLGILLNLSPICLLLIPVLKCMIAQHMCCTTSVELHVSVFPLDLLTVLGKKEAV